MLKQMKLSLVLFLLVTLLVADVTADAIEQSADTKQNVQVIENIYKNFETGDTEAILTSMAEDVIWEHPGLTSEIPFAGRFEGRAGVARFFDIAIETLDVLDQKIKELVADGDKVIALGYEHMRVKATGKEYQSDWAHVYTLSNGKITRFEEYIDTSALAAAFGEKQ